MELERWSWRRTTSERTHVACRRYVQDVSDGNWMEPSDDGVRCVRCTASHRHDTRTVTTDADRGTLEVGGRRAGMPGTISRIHARMPRDASIRTRRRTPGGVLFSNFLYGGGWVVVRTHRPTPTSVMHASTLTMDGDDVPGWHRQRITDATLIRPRGQPATTVLFFSNFFTHEDGSLVESLLKVSVRPSPLYSFDDDQSIHRYSYKIHRSFYTGHET